MPLRDVDLWLIDRLLVPASLHDVQGRFVHVNAAAERASGFKREDLVGRHFTVPLVPEVRKRVEAQFRLAAEHGEPTDFETVFVDASGKIRAVRAQHLPLRDGETIVGVLILAFEALAAGSLPGRDPQPRLTPRQHEVLLLIASGLSTEETAAAHALERDGPEPPAGRVQRARSPQPARGDRRRPATRAPRPARARDTAGLAPYS